MTATYCEDGKKYRAAAKAYATLINICEILPVDEGIRIAGLKDENRLRWRDHMNICTTCSKAYNLNIIREKERAK